jgi:hypothetical protein
MVSPFILVFVNQRVLRVLWEDLLLGFGIATFSLCRILSRRKGEIVFADWLVTSLVSLHSSIHFYIATPIRPLAKWNNLIVGAMVLSLSVYQDWKDEAARSNHWHRGAHS